MFTLFFKAAFFKIMGKLRDIHNERMLIRNSIMKGFELKGRRKTYLLTINLASIHCLSQGKK